MKKKGFTLIELLAVIVILALIAVISSPLIVGVIESARKSTYERTANGVIDAGMFLLSQNMLYEGSSRLEIDFSDSNDPNISKLNISGEMPKSGILSISNGGENVSIVINNGKYCARKLYNSDKIEVFDYNEDTCIGIYKEQVLNGGYPVLDKGMTPIYYDNADTARVADITDEWYSYEDSLWANAVIIKSDKRNNYKEIDKEVLEDDILAYFVWIPRYEYTIKGTYGVNGTSATEPGYIDINFVTADTSKVRGTATYTGTTPSNYLTHPAFTLGDEELSGIWVGKFETTGTDNGTTPIENPTIKPGIKALRSQNVSTQYLTALNFKNYGLENMSRMMKDDEWGSVAYLSQSLYGRCSESGTCEEIMRNNNSSYLTGYAAVNAATTGSSSTSTSIDTNQFGNEASITQPYNTSVGHKASTTGNITGIYDMSGGAWEYMMTVLADPNGNPRSGYTAIEYTAEQAATILGRTDGITVGIWNSGYNGLVYGKDLDNETPLYVTNGRSFPDSKYYNLYTSTNRDTACNGGKCYGHANSETPGWYGDYASMPSAANPWVVRGGGYSNGTSAGLFRFGSNNGRAYGSNSFRVVVACD